MTVCFWHLVKSDLSSVHYCTPVHWTSHFLQGTGNTLPFITGHPAWSFKLKIRKMLYFRVAKTTYKTQNGFTTKKYSKVTYWSPAPEVPICQHRGDQEQDPDRRAGPGVRGIRCISYYYVPAPNPALVLLTRHVCVCHTIREISAIILWIGLSKEMVSPLSEEEVWVNDTCSKQVGKGKCLFINLKVYCSQSQDSKAAGINGPDPGITNHRKRLLIWNLNILNHYHYHHNVFVYLFNFIKHMFYGVLLLLTGLRMDY